MMTLSTSRHVTSHPRTSHRIDVVDVVDTSLRHEHLPEINILGKHQSSF
jgi:hypothetical protein